MYMKTGRDHLLAEVLTSKHLQPRLILLRLFYMEGQLDTLDDLLIIITQSSMPGPDAGVLSLPQGER